MSWVDGLRHRVHVWMHSEEYQSEQAEERSFHSEMERVRGTGSSRTTGYDGSTAEGGATAPSLPPPAQPPPGRSPGGHGPARRTPVTLALERVRRDLGYALRGLARSPGFTLMAALTLALGVGANAAVFSVLDRVFGQAPAGVREPEGLRRLYIRWPANPEGGRLEPSVGSYFTWAAYSSMDGAVEDGTGMAAWIPGSEEQTVWEGSRELDVRASWVTHDYFRVLGVRAARGRLFGPEEESIDEPAPVVVLGHAFWERTFGSDPGVVGRTMQLDSTTFTVIGVAEEGFAGLDLSRTDVFFPLGAYPAEGQLGRPWYEFGYFLQTVARLAEGGDDRGLAARATVGFRRQVVPPRLSPDDTTGVILAGSIIAARGPAEKDQGITISARIALVSLVVLLIACANVAGLLLVRAVRRRREIALRRALGVSRARLMAHLLTESLVLAALAGGTAVVVAAWGGAALRRLLLPDMAWAQPVIEVRTVAFALSSAAAVGLVAGLVPVLHGLRVDVGGALKAGGREAGAPRSALRSGLLVVQAALSVLLLVGAGLFLRSLGKVAALRLGYDVDELAFVSVRSVHGLPADWPEALRDVASRLEGVPGVKGLAPVRNLPMTGAFYARVFLPGRDSLPQLRPGERPSYGTVPADFFRVTGMRILQGRGFEVGEENVVVVNQTMARTFWPGRSALGNCVLVGGEDGPCLEVVGVAEDARRYDVIEEPTLQLFIPMAADTQPTGIVLRVDRSRWNEIAAVVRAEMARHFDAHATSVRLMTESLEPQLRPWRLGAQLFTAFGVLALVVTIVGVYTVMAYAVSQRTHEMGVRIALGARLQDVLRLVLGDGLRVVALGVVLGLGLALALGRLVADALYGVTPRDPRTLAIAAAVLLATGAAASLLPAWRAGRVDPVRALSAE